MTQRTRKFWGWGYEDGGPAAEQHKRMVALLCAHFGMSSSAAQPPPRIGDIELRAARITAPSSLAPLATDEPMARASHTYGKSFRDIVRAYARDFTNPPDLVVAPRNEADVVAVLDWCTDARVAAVPYGGGTSVVGGVEGPASGDGGGNYRGWVSVDLTQLDRVIEVDPVSRAARVQAGVLGPALEDQLRPHGLTLRHYPQSFEFSSLGGWIATRAGGHFATLYTHIDDLVEALRVVTPHGIIETRRLPASGAGPSPDRLFVGSEGILGLITEAWMRLQQRPEFRATATATFTDFLAGSRAARGLAQAGLYPSNCRLLDAGEAMISGAGRGDASVLVLAFESADHAVDAWMARARELVRAHGGKLSEDAGADQSATREGAPPGARAGAAGAWRSTFLAAPYLRDVLVGHGMISETFETAITWNRFEDFHAAVMDATTEAVRRVCGAGNVTCRLTHVYPDGAAPYFTVIAPGRPGSQLSQWAQIKSAASDAIIAHGGTITHHHAVGRDHRPWYDRQRPEGFAVALRAAKHALDPGWILNPGVLIDP